MSKPRTDKRIECLTDLLTTAVEHNGYGFFGYSEYRWEDVPRGGAYALIYDIEDEDATYRLDLDVIAKGLGVIRNAKLAIPTDAPDGDSLLLCNGATGQRMYMSPTMRTNIMLVDRTNGDDGDYDVVDALAIVECALFGKVVYA